MDEEKTSDGLSRRDFLKHTATGASGVMLVIALGKTTLVSADSGLAGDSTPPARYIYLVDITKCIGCGCCVRACELENQVPPHFFRTWVERFLVSRKGDVFVESPNGARDGFKPIVGGEDIGKAFFVPKLCNHCTKTPCVQLCPVGASFRSPEGVILVDGKRCIGCSYCVQACPYGSRFIHPETHTASKCTLCYHRITKGLSTACVQACPVGARRLGDSQELHDEVRELVATTAVGVLKPELYTEPNCFYIGLSKEVR